MREPALVESFDESASADSRVHGVLLAAGVSRRFGRANKLLAPVDGEPMVRRAARTLTESRLDGVTVVVGHDVPAVRAAVSELPVETIYNDEHLAGQSTSVRRGVDAARAAGADAVLVALGDMPAVRPSSVDRLVAAYEAGVGSALAAAYEGERGNPVLFDASHFDRLAAVEGDGGGRELLLATPDAALVETGDPGTRQDLDTYAEYEQY